MKNCNLFQTKDGRFVVDYDWADERYTVTFNCDKIVYSDWKYDQCLKWLYRHEYMTYDDLREELYGITTD